MTAGAQPRHPDPAGWVRRLFARAVAGEIHHLNVRLDVAQLADVRGGTRFAVDVTYADAGCNQRDLLSLVWPADVPEIAEAMRLGALALAARDLETSWDAEPPGGGEG